MSSENNNNMQRRKLLCLISSGSSIAAGGCVGFGETDSTEQEPQSESTANTTASSHVRQWAREADAKGPSRPDGEPVSVDQSITDEPGYEQDDIEYFPQNQTVRYVKYISGGEPAAYGTWSFDEWARIETAEIGATQAQTVTAQRLDIEELRSGISSPPEDAETEGPVITLQISKEFWRDSDVVRWPVTTFPNLKRVAPHSVDVTLSIEGDTYSWIIPVYVEYVIMQYD